MAQAPASVTYMIMAEDAKRALRFYRDVFKAEIEFAAPDGSWSAMKLAGRQVCLHGNGTGASMDTGLALEVDDLEQACTAVENAGGQVLRPGPQTLSSGKEHHVGEWLAIVTDTEGNRFCMVRKGGCFLHPSLFPESETATVTS